MSINPYDGVEVDEKTLESIPMIEDPAERLRHNLLLMFELDDRISDKWNQEYDIEVMKTIEGLMINAANRRMERLKVKKARLAALTQALSPEDNEAETDGNKKAVALNKKRKAVTTASLHCTARTVKAKAGPTAPPPAAVATAESLELSAKVLMHYGMMLKSMNGDHTFALGMLQTLAQHSASMCNMFGEIIATHESVSKQNRLATAETVRMDSSEEPEDGEELEDADSTV